MLLTLAVALAYASTNFDNLALMLALAPALGIARPALAFVTTQALVIGLALAIGTALDSLPEEWLGLLGLIPMGIGGLELWRLWRARGRVLSDPPPASARKTGLFALLVTFAGLSADSFALTTAFLADSAPDFDFEVILGAVIALAAISLAGVLAARVALRAEALVRKLTHITPFIMIASGLYILLPTVTDVI